MHSVITWSVECRVIHNPVICVVILNRFLQGDFTRSLVNDPPRTLWTRELKVSGPVYQAFTRLT